MNLEASNFYMEIVFLGMNDAGSKVLDFLKGREEINIIEEVIEKEDLEIIGKENPELVISSGFEHKVPKEIIDIPEKGIVNLHPSYLPYNRGAHPYIWPLIDDTPAGVSVHYMNEEIDEGAIIARKKVDKNPEDDSKTLRDRLMIEQFELFKENWEEIKNGADAWEQDKTKGTTHKKKDLDEISQLNLEASEKVGNLVNRLKALSYTDEGLTYFEKDGERYFVNLDVTPESDLDR